jgi:hypothetical protein
MRCECCNKQLSDKEATARFAPTEENEPIRYVGMCTECQGFLPPTVKILTRADLSDERVSEEDYDKYVDSLFDLGEDDE